VSRSDNSRKGSKAFPKPGRGFTWVRRKMGKTARRGASTELAKGNEPEPYRHRHGARWGWW
jgi:hypothetical protein